MLVNGYYITSGETHEDWIAGGIKVTKKLYDYLKLSANGLFVKAIFDKQDFDFIIYLKEKDKQELQKDTSIPYGQYCIKENKIIQFKYRLMDKWDMSFELEIITPELLRDKDGREYHFVAVKDEKLEGLPK